MESTQTTEFCCTCLKTGIQLNTILEIDSKQLDYATKLRFCVPEVEWTSGLICLQCKGDLNHCYTFKEQCIKFNKVLAQRKISFLPNENFNFEDEKPSVIDQSTNNDWFSDNFVKIEVCNIEEPAHVEGKEEESFETKCNEVEDILFTERDQYSCSLCPNSYSDRNLLFLHKKNIHKEEQPYNCLHCEKIFKYYTELKRHEPVHSDHNVFVCDICTQTYHSSSILATHKKIKHTNPEEWKYSCSHCDKKYPFKSNLDQHVRRHHTNAGDTYICYHCNESHSTKILLIAHIRFKHTTRNTFGMKECNVCNNMYVNQVDLENHMRKDHNMDVTKKLKQFPCEKCGKKYTTTKILNMHARICDGVKMHYNCNKSIKKEIKENNLGDERETVKRKIVYLTCEFCDKIVGPYKRYVAHCTEEHGMTTPETLKPYVCKECKERFSTATLLSRHRFRHTGRKKVYNCSFCGKGFALRKDMLTHEKLHSNERDIPCELCSKMFHTKSYLRSHKLVVHTDRMRWKYVCSFCDKRFPMKSNYDHHVRRHTGEKPFACHLCEKRFSNRNVLQQHFNSHSDARVFKCEQCGKEYKSAGVMGIHLKKAHGIGNYKVPVRPKKFVCDHCSKSFSAKDKLERHMRSHTGEKPYMCHVCDKKFTDKSYVKRHLKLVHNSLD